MKEAIIGIVMIVSGSIPIAFAVSVAVELSTSFLLTEIHLAVMLFGLGVNLIIAGIGMALCFLGFLILTAPLHRPDKDRKEIKNDNQPS